MMKQNNGIENNNNMNINNNNNSYNNNSIAIKTCQEQKRTHIKNKEKT